MKLPALAQQAAQRGVAALRDAAERLEDLVGGTATPRGVDRGAFRAARAIGEDWRGAPYYDQAEGDIDGQWQALIWPLIADCDFASVVDLAAGHGRNSARLLEHAGQLTIVDIVPENVEHCRARFGGDPRVSYLVTDGLSLAGVPASSVTLLYTFDAMVHFDSDTVRAYLRECRRVLRPGGRGFFHHSNYAANPTGDFHQSPHWRNFMTRELFAHWAHKEGLQVVRSRVLDWGADGPALDCMTVVERPRS